MVRYILCKRDKDAPAVTKLKKITAEQYYKKEMEKFREEFPRDDDSNADAMHKNVKKNIMSRTEWGLNDITLVLNVHGVRALVFDGYSDYLHDGFFYDHCGNNNDFCHIIVNTRDYFHACHLHPNQLDFDNLQLIESIKRLVLGPDLEVEEIDQIGEFAEDIDQYRHSPVASPAPSLTNEHTEMDLDSPKHSDSPMQFRFANTMPDAEEGTVLQKEDTTANDQTMPDAPEQPVLENEEPAEEPTSPAVPPITYSYDNEYRFTMSGTSIYFF